MSWSDNEEKDILMAYFCFSTFWLTFEFELSLNLIDDVQCDSFEIEIN